MLNPYMAYERDSKHECAVLVFARTNREARKLVAPWLFSLIECEFTAMRVQRIRGDGEAFIRSLAKSDEPHVIDNPPPCKECETWGHEIGADGLCEGCRDWLTDDETTPSPEAASRDEHE